MDASANLRNLLPHGSSATIAAKLGISCSAVSQALKAGRPGNPIVQEALRIAKASGGLEAAQTLASLQKSA